MAVDLLAQRPDRDRARPARLRILHESHGPASRLDLPGLALASGGLLRPRLGPHQRQRRRLDEPADRRVARRSAPLLTAAFVAWELRAPAPMLPMRFFRRPGVRGRERRLAAHVLRHVRVDLPAGAVPADGAGPLAARRGPARAALDGDADARRADRRRALRSDRRSAADGRRARAPGDRPRLAGRGLDARRCRTRSWSCPFILSGAGMALFFAPVANVVLSAVRPEEEGQGLGRQQRDPRGRRRVRRRRAGVGLLAVRRLRVAADVRRRPRRRRSGSARSSSASARSSRWRSHAASGGRSSRPRSRSWLWKPLEDRSGCAGRC